MGAWQRFKEWLFGEDEEIDAEKITRVELETEQLSNCELESEIEDPILIYPIQDTNIQFDFSPPKDQEKNDLDSMEIPFDIDL